MNLVLKSRKNIPSCYNVLLLTFSYSVVQKLKLFDNDLLGLSIIQVLNVIVLT